MVSDDRVGRFDRFHVPETVQTKPAKRVAPKLRPRQSIRLARGLEVPGGKPGGAGDAKPPPHAPRSSRRKQQSKGSRPERPMSRANWPVGGIAAKPKVRVLGILSPLSVVVDGDGP